MRNVVPDGVSVPGRSPHAAADFQREAPMLTLSRLPLHCALAASVLVSTFSTPTFADDSLYRQFGGKEGIEHVIDDFYDRMLDDPRTKTFFEGASIPRIEKLLNQQFCALMGGPCVYQGRSMKRAHEGLGIDGKAFAAGIEDLKLAMAKNHIPIEAQKKLLGKLLPMAHDIKDHP
jgi:hemoglobin